MPRSPVIAFGDDRTLARLKAARAKMALIVKRNPVYAPIFDRLDKEVAARETSDPILRARAIVAAQSAIR